MQPLAERISIMEVELENLKTVTKDHEQRMRHSEKYMYIAMGALGILQIILKFIHL